tara:strand:- start:3930 stop:7355 length:3426 start_codon:yes stop_codon:yes gene_type:complete
MSSNTIIIESNRQIAYNEVRKAQSNEAGFGGYVEDSALPNKWKTHLPLGQQINTGDALSLEAAMINSVGGGDEVMEFVGQTGETYDSKPIDDSRMRINLGFYINNIYQFAFNLPKVSHRINTNFYSLDYGGPLWDSSGFPDANTPAKKQVQEWYIWNDQYPNDGIEGFSHDEKSARTYTYISKGNFGEEAYIRGALSKPNNQAFNPSTQRYYIGQPEWDGPFYSSGITEEESENIKYIPYRSPLDLEVPQGFSTPAAVAERLTSQLHQRFGDAASWDNRSIETAEFSLDSDGIIFKKQMPGITDITYQTFPTASGDPFYRRAEVGVNGVTGWAAAFKGEKSSGTAVPRGTNHSLVQGRRVFWSNILCGNMTSWEAVSFILPQVAQRCFVVDDANPFIENPLKMLFSGNTDKGAGQERGGNIIKIGELGCFPCLLDNVEAGPTATLAITNNLTTISTDVATSTSPNTAKRPIISFPTWGVKSGHIIPINMIFQASSINILTLTMDSLARVAIYSESENPLSEEFIQSIRCSWVLGRVDDEATQSAANRIIYLPNPNIENEAVNNTPYFQRMVAAAGAINSGKSYSMDMKITDYTNRSTLKASPRMVGLDRNNSTIQSIDIFRYGNNKIYTTEQALTNTIAGATNLYPHNNDSLFQTAPPNKDKILLEKLYRLISPINGSITKRGIGIIPVFYKDGSAPHPSLVNVPFVGLISAGKSDNQILPLPTIGEYFGPGSPSLTQNLLAKIVSTQKTDTNTYPQFGSASAPEKDNESNPDKYMPYIYAGAVDSLVDFDSGYSRFTISKFHTSTRQGNGPFQDIDEVANNQPETENMLVYSQEAMLCTIDGVDLPVNYKDEVAIPNPQPVISSQSGVGILSVSAYQQQNKPIEKSNIVPISNLFPQQFENTLLYKCGFSIEQLVPMFGLQNNEFNRGNYNRFLGFRNISPLDKQNNMVLPFTTNAYISAAVIPSLAQGIRVKPSDAAATAPSNGPVPSANLGALIAKQATTESNSDLLIAYNMPQKLDYPYLVVYTDIIRNPSYYGGPNGHQKLQAIAYITRNYAEGDFFYSFATSWNYTADTDYVITDITTDIRLPDGRPAPIDKNSSVIYKLVKPQAMPPSIQQLVQDMAAQQKLDEKMEKSQKKEK